MIAAAFAVAFAVLITSSPTTVEAKDVIVGGTNTAKVEPGDTAVITVANAEIVRFTIDGENSTSTGSFASGGDQTLACSDDGSCDTGVDGDNADIDGSVQVKLNVDEDSADGFIILRYTIVLTDTLAVPTTETSTTVVITVTTEPKPARLAVKAASTTINADGSAAGGSTQIRATVTNNQKTKDGMNDERITFITTLGTLNCPASGVNPTNIAAAQNVQWCQVWTSTSNFTGDTGADGNAVVTLTGGNREGTATITVTHGTLDAQTLEVTLFGDAKNLVAEAEQDSIEVGGSVFVVLTVTDGADNPVKGVQPEAGDEEVVGPEDDSNLVTTAVDEDGAYNVNKDKKTQGEIEKGDIPACGPVTEVVAIPDQTPDPVVGVFASTGTNDDGQCVVEVTATPDVAGTADNEASARGVHTINFVLGDLEASVEIEVAGAPSSLETSPATGSYLVPLSDNEVIITVRDDEGVLVGETTVEVLKVQGDGLIEGITDGSVTTTNGIGKFTYTAPLSEGTAVFRIRAGKGDARVQHVLELNTGSEPVEVVVPPPAAPSLSKQPAAQGFTLVTFTGGSVDELATALTDACGAGVRAYATDYQGNYVSFIPGTMVEVVNAPFNALFSDGVPANEPLLVGGCGG